MNKEAQACNKNGVQLLNSDQPINAIDFFTKAIEIDPEFTDAYVNRSEAYRTLDRIVEANTDMEKAKALKSGKLKRPQQRQDKVPRLKMDQIDNIYDTLISEDNNAGYDDESFDFDTDLYNYVFSDDIIDTDEDWDDTVPESKEVDKGPAILEFLDGGYEDVSSALIFQPTINDISILENDGSTERVIPFEQLCCIRLTYMPPELKKFRDSSCHIEIIETLDGNIFYESIHPEQDHESVLVGFSTKKQTRYKYTIFPTANIKKRSQKRFLGEILLEKKYITKDMLKNAIEELDQTKKMKLGKIIAQNANILHSVIEAEIQKAYNNNMQGLKTGEILLAAGLVNENQVLDALEYQETMKKKQLGQFLIDKGILQEKELYISLAEKFRIPFVDLRKQKVSKSILNVLPQDFVVQNTVMPLTLEDSTLLLATLNPDPFFLCETILKQSKFSNVKFVLVQPTHLKNIINVLYKKMSKKSE